VTPRPEPGLPGLSHELVRVSGGPSTWQWGILGAAALISVIWLVAAPVRSFRRGRRPRPASRDQREATRRWRRVTALVASVTALVMLGTVTLIAWRPELVDTGYAGKLDLSAAEQLAVHLPLAITVLGSSMLILATSGWIGRWWPSAVRLQYVALAVATIALVPLLAGWHLIGWSMS
jgi:hypothetical protein